MRLLRKIFPWVILKEKRKNESSTIKSVKYQIFQTMVQSKPFSARYANTTGQ
jgi:hypothetical protein